MISGSILRDSIISAANNITQYKQQVDELNVFPVPDGDTGTNMSMTINAAARELARLPNTCTVSEVSSCAASALLRGARGNSGVILSLLFRGIAKGLKDKEKAGTKELAEALSHGVDSAYKAVMKPTEGTILTVARLAAKKARLTAEENDDVIVFWEIVCKAARDALAKTPELLPVLKKAGVVDAGGKGLTLIFEGMFSVFKDGVIIEYTDQTGVSAPAVSQRNAAAEFEGEITFTYCTEFIVNRNPQITKDPLALRAYLESIGDSVVVVEDESIIKVHVHTDNPGNALQEGLNFGSLTNLKIENMREQHQAQIAANAASAASNSSYVPVDPTIPYGFVAVCAGQGIEQLFTDLGANEIVSGGQTMNPSTDDILRAIEAVPAQTVIVLPNNKNIIMAAEQTIPIADRNVCVLQTRTIPQGLAAMLAFDADNSIADNQLNMTKAAERVGTGHITFAARDSDFDGHKIKQGEILGLENGKLSFTERDIVRAATKLTRALIKKDSSFITLIYGADATEEQALQVEQAVRQKLGQEVEIAIVNGGQPIYYFIISVE